MFILIFFFFICREKEQKHWKLSCNETFSRMRLKLRPNLYFNPHTDASNLRDNTGISTYTLFLFCLNFKLNIS